MFFVIYLLCGISDVLDGYLARKLKVNSAFGSMLDSIADVVFIGTLLLILINIHQWDMWQLTWVGLILLIRLVSLTVGFVKYRDLAFIHTYSNKFAGVLLFTLPFSFALIDLDIMVFTLCSVATLSSIEELLINVTSDELSHDAVSIFKNHR